MSRRLRADLLANALEGGARAHDALDRLGLVGQPVGIVALKVREPPDSLEGDLASARERLNDALAMHLTAVHPRSAAALIGDVAYGLVPLGRLGSDGEERAARVATDFLDRVSEVFRRRRGRPGRLRRR